jgi:rubrerythrin
VIEFFLDSEEDYMSESKTVEILKGALLLEHRGKALYESVGRQTEVAAVGELFDLLVKEEVSHIEILSKQLGRAAQGEALEVETLEAGPQDTAGSVLSGDIVKAISGAGYEAAVIAAGLDFEARAVDFYSRQAKEAETEAERKLYSWLAEWERGHMQMFAELDRQLREQIWYDNSFWPF